MKKNFKKITYLLAVIIALCIVTVSCEKNGDSQDSTATLAGTVWEKFNQTFYYDAQWNPYDCTDTMIIVFQTSTQGQITIILDVPDLPEANEKGTYPFIYTYEKPNGSLTSDEGDTSYTYDFSIIGTKLVLSLGDGYSYVFSQKNDSQM